METELRQQQHSCIEFQLLESNTSRTPELILFDILKPSEEPALLKEPLEQEVDFNGQNVEVSTKLELYSCPWKIKKRLLASDIGNLYRLLIPTNLVKAHILEYFKADVKAEVYSGDGTSVKFCDVDTNTSHTLTFKYWSTSKSYVFNKGWNPHFVQRRNLKEGDEIGLLWDDSNSQFYFSVISRAPNKVD